MTQLTSTRGARKPQDHKAKAGRPVALLDLDDYVSTYWRLSKSRARKLRLTGKVNVNGKVVYAERFAKRDVTVSEEGNRRIMVEGMKSPEQRW